MLAELLAVVGGDDHQRMVEDAAFLEAGEQVAEDVVGEPDLGVVQRHDVGEVVGGQVAPGAVDVCQQVLAGGYEAAREVVEALVVAGTRFVRRVDLIGVKEEEQRLLDLAIGVELVQQALRLSRDAAALVVESDEAAPERLRLADVAAAGDGEGQVAAAAQDLLDHQGAGWHAVDRAGGGAGAEAHPVRLGVEGGQHGGVGGRGAVGVDEGVREAQAPGRQLVEERRRFPGVSEAAQVVRATGVERDEDDVRAVGGGGGNGVAAACRPGQPGRQRDQGDGDAACDGGAQRVVHRFSLRPWRRMVVVGFARPLLPHPASRRSFGRRPRPRSPTRLPRRRTWPSSSSSRPPGRRSEAAARAASAPSLSPAPRRATASCS